MGQRGGGGRTVGAVFRGGGRRGGGGWGGGRRDNDLSRALAVHRERVGQSAFVFDFARQLVRSRRGWRRLGHIRYRDRHRASVAKLAIAHAVVAGRLAEPIRRRGEGERAIRSDDALTDHQRGSQRAVVIGVVRQQVAGNDGILSTHESVVIRDRGLVWRRRRRAERAEPDVLVAVRYRY